jgi:hypothetical protein
MSSSRRAPRAAALFGALGILAIPAGVAVPQVVSGVGLVRALYVAVPAAALCGLIAVVASRRARYQRARSITGSGGGRIPGLLAWAGLYAGVTGALALGVYAVLRSAQ